MRFYLVKDQPIDLGKLRNTAGQFQKFAAEVEASKISEESDSQISHYSDSEKDFDDFKRKLLKGMDRHPR